MKVFKCNLCGKIQNGRKYTRIEYWDYEIENKDDSNFTLGYEVCNICKDKISKFIVSLRRKGGNEK